MGIYETLRNILFSIQLAPFSMDIPILVRALNPVCDFCFVCSAFLKALANGGIFSGIFLGISVEMVLAGLRDGYS